MKRKLLSAIILVAFTGMLTACGSSAVVVTPTLPLDRPALGPSAAGEKETAEPSPTEMADPMEGEDAKGPTEEIPRVDPEPPAPKTGYDARYDTVRAFFEDAVYCGDSLMNFYQWRGNQYVNPGTFGSRNARVWLAVNGFSVRQAIAETTNETDPKYNGNAEKLWVSVPALEKHQVFMFFGLNDIGVTGVDRFVENYKILIEKIEATGFPANYYVLSITSMRKDMQSTTGGLTNEKIREANEKLEIMCAENGWRFVDVASRLRDADYNLLLDYSDKKTNVHIIKEGYVFWDDALIGIANEFLK